MLASYVLSLIEEGVNILAVNYGSPGSCQYSRLLRLYLSRVRCGSRCHLPNTRSLRLGMLYDARYLEGLIILLKLTAKRKILSMEFTWSFDENWKSRDEDVACLSHNLKEVHITGSCYFVLPTEFVKFLLQNAKVLENIQISLEEQELDPKKVTTRYLKPAKRSGSWTRR